VLENILSDIRFACRWLRRSPAFTLVAVLSLATGIGFNAALFAVIDEVLFRPLPVSRPDRLVEVYTSSSDGDVYATSSYPDLLDFKARNDVFVDMLAYSPSMAALAVGDRSRLAMGETVTGNYFPLLGVKAALGRTLLPEDDRIGAPRAAMISSRTWRRDFGADPSVVGRTIRIHGQPYTIVGVAPATFTGMFPLLSPELWTPIAFVDDVEPGGIISTVPSPTGNTRLERRGQRWMFIKGRLKDGVTPAAAAANLRLIGRQLTVEYPQTNKRLDVAAIPTSSVRIHPMADRALVPIAAAAMFAVGLVLLVACANVASMLLARASGRQKEIGIRLAIGASRRRIVQQLLSETAVMAVLGAASGIALAWAFTRLLASMPLPIPIPLTIELHIDARVLVFTAAVAVLASLVAGLAPALKSTRPNLVGELKGDTQLSHAAGRRWTLRDALVVAQIAVTMVLLVGAGLLMRSLLAAEKIDLGFRPGGLAIVSTEMNMIGYDDTRAKQFYERALEQIRALPGVQGAALAERLPLSMNYNRSQVFLPDRASRPVNDDKGIVVDNTRVSPEYFATMGIAIVRGRNFATTDTPASPGVAIINEAMARRFWPDRDPIGQQIRRRGIDGPAYTIVGIAADHKVNTVGEDQTPYIHYAVSQFPSSGESIIARTHGDAGALLAAMRKELLALEPDVLFVEQQTMATQVDATLLPIRAGAVAVTAVSAVAMLLAAVGLYGVIAYAVARRTREIGIRIALGARSRAVVALVMRQGLALATAGAALGSLLSLGAAKAISGALYGVGAFDPVTWIGAIVTLFAVAAAANAVPARRAAVVDPSLALRSE
jgi:predicted permease